MKSSEHIVMACHRVEVKYTSKSKFAKPSTSDLEYISCCIGDGQRHGTLCTLAHKGSRQFEFEGAWKVLE